MRYFKEANYESSANELRKARGTESQNVFLFQYCEAMSYYQTKITDNLAKALNLLADLKSGANTSSKKLISVFANYGLACIYMSFKDYKQALNQSNEGMDTMKHVSEEPNDQEEIFQDSIWQDLSKLFPELQLNNLKDFLNQIRYDSRYFRKPMAYCRGVECFDVIAKPYVISERAIYSSDIDFEGLYSMIGNFLSKTLYPPPPKNVQNVQHVHYV